MATGGGFLGRVFDRKAEVVLDRTFSKGEKPSLTVQILEPPNKLKKCKIYQNMLYNPLDPPKTYGKNEGFFCRTYMGFFPWMFMTKNQTFERTPSHRTVGGETSHQMVSRTVTVYLYNAEGLVVR